MAFDGIVIANLVHDIRQKLEGGKINKIAQPEKDELMFTVKNNKETLRLSVSASASLPLVYFTETNKPSPLTAPNFCMLLRKHIGTGRIVKVSLPGLERIIEFEIEHLDELGDLRRKRLIIELMGKHSNIIFCKEDGTILDSIKHVSAQVSSVREVLPGRMYFIPHTTDKEDPLTISEEIFANVIGSTPAPVQKALYQKLTGISPIIGTEICNLASIDGDRSANELSSAELTHLYHMFDLLMEDVKNGRFTPNIIYRGEEPVEFSSVPLTCYESAEYQTKPFGSISRLLDSYYSEKSAVTRIRQKSADLRKIVQTALDRNRKKLSIQQKQMKDTEKKDKYKIYGELINAYGYGLEEGCKSFKAVNYYNGEEITIPLDPTLTPQENSKKYFDRYGKLKRTQEALEVQIADTASEIEHLESISNALDIATEESDLSQIKEELMEYGYVKRHYGNKKGAKMQVKSKPFHYVSSDGYDIYVGKNNYQNDELTFKFATGNDWWFHAKKMPGSHVVVKTKDGTLPDRTFEEAGNLAAYYSKGRTAPKVEIDYLQKKNVKKPAGAKPGFVVYYTNYSLMASPDITGIEQLS